MIHMAVRVLAVLAITTLAAQADLHLAPGTKIVFGDSSELASAPEPGDEIPAGHGGTGNTVSGTNAYVGGGVNNIASGVASTVPGGSGNTASGNYSFAAGRRAKSTAAGTMTFADSRNADFTNNLPDSFRIRAANGFYLIIEPPDQEFFAVNENGNALLTGTLLQESDRNAKENFASVENHRVLELVATLPIETYNYRGEDPANVHMGVMAQDFNDAFGLGGEPGFIAVVDAQGVAFASIQALYDMVLERDERIEALESTLEAVLSRLDALETDSAR